jgi:rubredoxin
MTVILHGYISCENKEKNGAEKMKQYMCVICGFVYDEEQGWPEDGIPPGTKWEDVPPNWVCPECGARKEDFEMIEI